MPGRAAALGRIGGGLLIFHSFRDGMAIGAAFAASHTAGYAVATGIAAHDFGDGMNTVILTTAGEKAGLADYGFPAAGCDCTVPRRSADGLVAALLASRDGACWPWLRGSSCRWRPSIFCRNCAGSRAGSAG